MAKKTLINILIDFCEDFRKTQNLSFKLFYWFLSCFCNPIKTEIKDQAELLNCTPAHPFYKITALFLCQENIGLVIPWLVGILTFMSLEAVSTVYLNILRDHINGASLIFWQKKNRFLIFFTLLNPHSILTVCARQKL